VRRYVEDIQQTVRRISEAVQRGNLVDREIAALARWTARSRENAAFLSRVRDAEAFLRDAEEALELGRKRFGDTSADRRQAQQRLRSVEAAEPRAFNVLSRREWASKRRDQRRRTEDALRVERDAWRQVRDGGSLPVAVDEARNQLVRTWDTWCAAASVPDAGAGVVAAVAHHRDTPAASPVPREGLPPFVRPRPS
jgi:hypothetical protein